jgi:tetratricopeptide (TPR) repeat protein
VSQMESRTAAPAVSAKAAASGDLRQVGEVSPEQLSELKLLEAQTLANEAGPGEAIEALRAALREFPDFVAGWQQLAEWYGSLGDGDGLLEATEQLAKLKPDDPASLSAYGDALARAGERAQAEQHFALALQLDGSSTFAGFWLFDLLFAEQRFADADRILERLRQHGVDGPFLFGREAQLAAASDDKETANEKLSAICQCEGDIRWPLNAAAQALRKAGWRFDVRDVLEAAMQQPGVNPEAGSQWMRVVIADGGLPTDVELRELASRDAAGLQAVATLGEALLDTGHSQQAIEFVLRNQNWLRESTALWGMGGYVLATETRYREAVRWMSDWRKRSDVEAWMLFNLVEALRATDDDATARQVSEHALTLPPDHTHDLHRLWLAVDRPFEQPELLEYAATAIATEGLSNGAAFLHSLVAAMFEAGVAGHRQLPFDAVRAKLEAAVSNYRAQLKREPGHRRVLRKAIRQISACYDGWAPKLWRLTSRLY